MSEQEAYSERGSFDLHDEYVVDGGDMSQYIAGARRPIHYGGMAAALSNADPDVTVNVSVQDSPNGVTWSPVVLSTMEGGQGQTVFAAIVPGGQQQIFFLSRRRYIRFSAHPYSPAGIRVVTHQWSPRVRRQPAEVY